MYNSSPFQTRSTILFEIIRAKVISLSLDKYDVCGESPAPWCVIAMNEEGQNVTVENEYPTVVRSIVEKHRKESFWASEKKAGNEGNHGLPRVWLKTEKTFEVSRLGMPQQCLCTGTDTLNLNELPAMEAICHDTSWCVGLQNPGKGSHIHPERD